MPLKVGAEKGCWDHWLLSNSQDGLYGTKSGSSTEFILSDKGECFWIHKEGPWIMFRKATFPLSNSSLEVFVPVSLPLPKEQTPGCVPPSTSKGFSPCPVLSPTPQARREIPHSRVVQFSPSHPTIDLINPSLSPSCQHLPFLFPVLPHLFETPKPWLRRMGRCEGGLFSGGSRKEGRGEMVTWDLSCWRVEDGTRARTPLLGVCA